MARKFQFDDEIEEVITPSDEVIKQTNQFVIEDEINQLTEVVENNDTLSTDEDEGMAKKKKFVMKWWHYALLSVGILMIAFIVYIFIKSNNDGPVYGNRLDGLLSIEQSALDQTESSIKSEYDEVEMIDLSVEGKKVKFNITFKDDTSTKKVQTISEDALKTLDEFAGYDKGDKEYSHLLGIYKNVTQYEANFYLIVEDNNDFPAFATKHVQKDEIVYTFASIVDQESHDKAQSTLED